MRSPWERALGDDLTQLDASLHAYFSAIPSQHVGTGSGVFAVVGTPRRWLWPVLGVLSLDGVVFPVWEKDVAFTVVNTPTANGTIRSERTFHFGAGDRTMVDEIGITAAGLVDRLGRRGTLEATLDASVAHGRLRVRSRAVTIRLGAVRIPLGVLSPRVTLIERRDGARQHVSLVLDAPVIGRLYEYAGSFAYRIEREATRD